MAAWLAMVFGVVLVVWVFAGKPDVRKGLVCGVLREVEIVPEAAVIVGGEAVDLHGSEEGGRCRLNVDAAKAQQTRLHEHGGLGLAVEAHGAPVGGVDVAGVEIVQMHAVHVVGVAGVDQCGGFLGRVALRRPRTGLLPLISTAR